MKILISFNYAYLINSPPVYSLQTSKPVELELFSGISLFFCLTFVCLFDANQWEQKHKKLKTYSIYLYILYYMLYLMFIFINLSVESYQ